MAEVPIASDEGSDQPPAPLPIRNGITDNAHKSPIPGHIALLHIL